MGGRGVFANATGKERSIFGNAIAGSRISEHLFPARVNRLYKTGDLDKITKHFKQEHDSAHVEYGILVSSSGYAVSYRRGDSGSVNFVGDEIKGNHVVHNHPKGGWANFSGEDLELFVERGATGFTAVSRKEKAPPTASAKTKKAYKKRRAGTYKIERTGRFKDKEFLNAIKNLKVKDDDYDHELHKWLLRNQRAYGYKYSYKKSKK